MAAPSYDEIVGSQSVPSYDEITSGQANALTDDQRSLLSNIDMTPFHTAPSDSKVPLQMTAEPTGIDATLSDAYQTGRRLFSPLIGPTQSEKMEQSIPWGVGPNGEQQYAYKPLGDAPTRRGLIPSIMDAGSAMLDVPTAVQLAQQGRPLTLENVDAQRATQGFQAQPDDNALQSILKGAANATTNFSHAIGSPVSMALGPSRLVSGYFGADMLANVPQQLQQGVNAPDLQGRVEGLLGAGSSLLMGGASLGHAFAPAAAPTSLLRSAPPDTPDVAPPSAGASPLPSAVEPTPLSGQGAVPIMGGEGTPVEGAPPLGAPLLRSNDPLAFQPPAVEAAPQSAESLLNQFHMEQDPIKKQDLWQQAKAAAEAGPDFVPPTEPPPEAPTAAPASQDSTGIKRAIVDAEREGRGQPEIPTAQVVDDETAVNNAKTMLDQDPTAGQAVVARINGGDPRISKQDAGLLLAERNRIVQQRTQWEDRAAQSTDPTERAHAAQQLQGIEEQLSAVDNASRTAGSEWSGVGRMYQRTIADDYSLDALQRKARAAKAIATGDGALEPNELATIKQQAADYQKLQAEAAEKQQALESAQKEANQQADTVRAHEQTIKEMQAAEAARPKFGQAVFDQAQKIVDRLKVNADASRVKLRQALSQMNAGVDPTVIVHTANILAHKVGEFGLKKAEAFAQMVDEFGDKITPHLEKAWKQAKKLIGAEPAPDEVKKAVKSGVAKGKEPAVVDATAKLKADATAGDPLSHKAVYDVWRAKVREGKTNVDEAAKATHETVKQSYPDATEQQVREAFSQYGKVKFPSKEADKVTLAEHRRITQLQLSIDRLKAGLDPLHTGLQRDKATQTIREKQAELNELLKQRTGPPSPEALAGRNEARKTALRNSIADLDKQLRTGEKPIDKSTPLPYDPEVERLTAERNAMKDKLAEIEREENPPPTEAETYNKNRLAQIERESKKAQARIDAGDYGPRPPKPQKELFADTAEAHAKLQALRDKIKSGQQQWKISNRTPSQKGMDALKTLWHAPRNLAIFGHGTVGMFTHAGAVSMRPTHMASFWQHFGEQFKLLSSEQHFNEKVHELKTSPNYNAWRDAGANIDPDSHASDYGSMADEMTKLFESHAVTRPLVTLQKAGNRGFFALKMYRLAMNEADLAEAPDDLKSDPATKKELMRQIADTNNKATGTLTKGNDWLNQGARWAPIREGLFAPKLLFSKIARTVVDPIKTAGTLYDWSKGKASDVDKYMAIKRMKNAGWMVGTALGGLLTNQAILSATGSNQQVNFDDPTKSDWLAFKMGGKVISPYGGLLDILRFVGHLMHDFGGTLSPRQARDGRGAAALDTTGKFLRSKLTPTLGLIADTATGYDINSRPVPQRNERQKYADAPRYSWTEYALNKGPIPISQGVKSFYDSMRATGMSKPEALSLLQAADDAVSATGSMVLGATGIHAGEDYAAQKAQPRSLLRKTNP